MARADQLLAQFSADDGLDLLVLPEMAFVGYTFGDILAIHDKHHLFVTDKTWADEGKSFTAIDLPHLGIRVGLGICMDINPYEFEAPFTDFEFANFQKQEEVDVILFSSAWCNVNPEDSIVEPPPPDLTSTLNYWGTRLSPLIHHPVHFVCADRVGKESMECLGKEGETTFCGCSCIIDLGAARVLGVLDTVVEAVLVQEIKAGVPQRLPNLHL
eukprot:gene11459-13543_t